MNKKERKARFLREKKRIKGKNEQNKMLQLLSSFAHCSQHSFSFILRDANKTFVNYNRR